ncbi:MAG: hypothetical protein L0Z53_23305 [Acidobacteriales bacterium]|nr:hypothetical protein [Terriglobales bacterium]
MAKKISPFVVVCLILFAGGPIVGQDSDGHPVTLNLHIRDYCDPASFAAAGIACNRITTPVANGVITLSGFGAELAIEKSVGAWRFVPPRFKAGDGVNLVLQNLGGQTHTFTRVQKFGGGFVAGINAASGNPVPAPECAQVVNGNLVPQPPSANNIFLPGSSSANGPQIAEGETARFQCCIHPWMRTTISAKGKDDDGSRDNRGND